MGDDDNNVTMPIEVASSELQRKKRKNVSFFEMAQLLISLALPLTVIIYTVVQNNTNKLIAEKTHQQDLEIARQSREQDMLLASDQQEEATLVNYFDSLSKLLEKNGKNLSGTPTGRLTARFKTLTALAQLKAKRKTFVIRSLIESELITIQDSDGYPIIPLNTTDLTGVDFSKDLLMGKQMICVDFSETTMENASFEWMVFSGSRFTYSRLTNSNFQTTYAGSRTCGSARDSYGVLFYRVTLDNSIFTRAAYQKANFEGSTLYRAQMAYFTCSGCNFRFTSFNEADMSYTKFRPYKDSNDETLSEQTSNFFHASMTSTFLYGAKFFYALLREASLSRANATLAFFSNCLFDRGDLSNATFAESEIANSSFLQANLANSYLTRAHITNTDFTGANMQYVQFTHGQCHHCLFNSAELTGADFTNTSLAGSDFTGANVTYAQLVLARSLAGVTLPDGIVVD